jgi:hypothetical protein
MASFIDSTFTSDGFWPDVVVRDWMEGWRIPSDAKDSMLGQALLGAIIDTIDALTAARDTATALGYENLDDYAAARFESDTVNDIPVLETLYLQAVGNLAKARVLRRQQAQQRRPADDKEMLAADLGENYFQNEYQNAVGRILKRMLGSVASTNFGIHVSAIGGDEIGFPGY